MLERLKKDNWENMLNSSSDILHVVLDVAVCLVLVVGVRACLARDASSHFEEISAKTNR